jgi:hypothetical protein
MNLMARKTSSDSGRRVRALFFGRSGLVYDSVVAANRWVRDVSFCPSPHLRVNRPPWLKPYRIGRVGVG